MARMDSTLYVQYPAPHQLTFVPANMYAQVYPASPVMSQASPYLRSPAQHGMRAASPRQFYPATYDPSSVEVYSEDDFSSDTSSSSSVPLQEGVQDYAEPNYHLTATTVATPYSAENTVPRSVIWAKEEATEFTMSPAVVESQLPNAHFPDAQVPYESYCEQTEFAPPEMSPYYESDGLSQDLTLSPYRTSGNTLPSVVHNFSHSPRLDTTNVHEQSVSPKATYRLVESMQLQYPPSPQEAPSQFVSLQDVSPSPTVSPDQVYSPLPIGSPAARYIVAQPATPSSVGYDDHTVTQFETPTPTISRKRRRPTADEEDFDPVSDSGESEQEESDDEYRPSRDNVRNTRRRTMLRTMYRDESPVDLQRPRLDPPVPVPNLTKKSRGRQVPTNAMLVNHNGVEKNVRSYHCNVPGCSKYFQRGEHLKRHIRSIHTNEKPHKCPYRACGKDFSRHDNLRQHMRVHRNDRLDSEGTSGSA